MGCRTWLPILASTGAALLCSGSAVAQDYQSRDSAGVLLVWTAPTPATSEWRLDPEPVLQIGKIEGADPYLFTEVWDAARLDDGRIVAVDVGTHEVRVFAGDGTHLWSFGRRGEGPEEFGGPPWIVVAPPDTIVTWDAGHLRLSRFTLEGELIHQQSLSGALEALSLFPCPVCRVWQPAPDGTLLNTMTSSQGMGNSGVQQQLRRVVFYDPTTGSAREFSPVLAGRISWISGNARHLRGYHDPFSPSQAVARGPDSGMVTVSHPERAEWTVYRPDGSVAQIVRPAMKRDLGGEEARAAERRRAPELAEQLGVGHRELIEAMDALPVPDSLPAIRRMFWDRDQRLWVGSRTRDSQGMGPFGVFDRSGRWLAEVGVPRDLVEILGVGDDYVLASWRDEFDVAYLRLYRLERNP